ncbi:zinc ABC transporter solute-binding protein [bacterium]|jgi:manganese/zinc/iron transport system substrate-binding protein|nr:zinc ABC transporter solute-binding protein [bacterium]
MKNVLGLLCIGLLLITAGCQSDKKVATADQLTVVTTIGMIADVAQNIGGKHVVVNGLMGPGVDPHLYRASAGDVTVLSSADVIFYNGLHLEAKMGEVLAQMGRTRTVVAVAANISKSNLMTPLEFEGVPDPHIWFDLTLWRQIIPVIRDTYIKVDPKNKVSYTKNAADYLKQLNALHQETIEIVKQVPKSQRVVVTAHDAFSYFGRQYGFEVVGLQGISTESEAGTQDVQRVAELIATRKIPAIFVESSIPVRHIKAVQRAVQARGWNVAIGGELFSDAMGSPDTKEGTFVGMIRHNVNVIVTALSGK